MDREPTTVVGIQTHYEGDDSIFEALWQEFGQRWDEFQSLATGDEAFGVMTDVDLETMEFDYTVGVAVDTPDEVPDELVTVDVPGGSYAVFETTLERFESDHEAVLSEWLPQSGYEHGASPEFELYGPEFESGDPTSAYDYYVPVTPTE
ncbi:AraC family transcriptional regulator [Haloferax elongans ATCC BAA-1513]|uniref:AraC family transcriptional regulator n=1 Tax=Haloferax elongans ATCC BAA-1513 TaxID=1230453 RepID=M0HU48_HALEO|nr:AraC family transcriptional regulator [Haloferax elongans ATCC BAA-1513]